jgi:hypothetical protein
MLTMVREFTGHSLGSDLLQLGIMDLGR